MTMLIYLIGCIISYPRIVAMFYEIEERYVRYIGLSYGHPLKDPKVLFCVFFSWLTVGSGLVLYIINRDKYFWKFSYKDLKNPQ